MNEHLENARSWYDRAAEASKGSDERAQAYATLSIAEALTGILELLTGVIGDRGSVVDVRVSGSVSTGDQR